MTKEQATGKDSILAFLVQATNKHNVSIDITLNVNGAIVTGTTVSAKEYFVSLSETFEDGSDVAQQLSEKLAQAGEAIDSEEDAEASFIHLKDTKIFCGSSKSTPSKGEALWRGPLSDINGFFLDNIPDSDEEQEQEESDNSDYQSLKDKNGKLTDRIGKLEDMIAKLSPDNQEEDKSEESEGEEESEEKPEEKPEQKQDSSEEPSEDDKEKEKNQKKRSGTKSSTSKTQKKTTAKKTTKSK
ncbi:gas vesicle accessory protein GvpU [Bacillus sp. LL01]|uniref:gas vesicle accessory protein GvpU n=1 Tax=Bacillus sp. LL01 TaxID=1665556 RepID=UPI000AE66209|nr:gas vesicle accessory protein GvpU [Bacillus sp. LL01]